MLTVSSDRFASHNALPGPHVREGLAATASPAAMATPALSSQFSGRIKLRENRAIAVHRSGGLMRSLSRWRAMSQTVPAAEINSEYPDKTDRRKTALGKSNANTDQLEAGLQMRFTMRADPYIANVPTPMNRTIKNAGPPVSFQRMPNINTSNGFGVCAPVA